LARELISALSALAGNDVLDGNTVTAGVEAVGGTRSPMVARDLA